ncbi:hypothetical protein JCM5353_005059 [Sporobolomyces roseus]
MNFNSLPNETLQRIVDLCHEADEAYKKRIKGWLEEATEAKTQNSNPWRGRSCSAVSMVNKTLRILSAKYIFTTLRLSKIQAPIFQFHLVKSSLTNYITRLVFDRPYSPLTPNAFILFGHFAEHLPNISAIVDLDDSNLKGLCGASGLSSGSRLGANAATSDYELQRKQNRNVFAQLVAQVNHLDLQLDAKLLDGILSRNLGGIKGLKISSKFPPILQSPDSQFPAVLAKCSNLEFLSIGQNDDEEEEEEDADETETIHDSFLEIPYLFIHTLRSLTLNFPHSFYSTPFSELQFAALFPSLDHLSITLRSLSLPTLETKILLPSLTTLKLGTYSLVSITALLKSLEAPSISTLHAVTPDYHQLFSPTTEVAKSQAEEAATALNAYQSTLNNLTLVSLPVDPPRAVHRLFTLLGGSVAIHYNSKPLNEESRKLSTCQSTDQQVGSTPSVRSPPPVEHYSPSTLVYKDSMRILDWAVGYVRKTKGKDKIGAKQLLGCLKPVEEFMEWMEE